jgi:hypothetical protein
MHSVYEAPSLFEELAQHGASIPPKSLGARRRPDSEEAARDGLLWDGRNCSLRSGVALSQDRGVLHDVGIVEHGGGLQGTESCVAK